MGMIRHAVTYQEIRNRISTQLTEILRERDMTQVELAAELGVSGSYLNQVINQKCEIGMKGLIRIAEALHIDPVDLLMPIEK